MKEREGARARGACSPGPDSVADIRQLLLAKQFAEFVAETKPKNPIVLTPF
jgi:hypothetical protein